MDHERFPMKTVVHPSGFGFCSPFLACSGFSNDIMIFNHRPPISCPSISTALPAAAALPNTT